jgi:hypothetical protein
MTNQSQVVSGPTSLFEMFKAVWGHGYTQREVANHLWMHFTSVSQILRTKNKMLIK